MVVVVVVGVGDENLRIRVKKRDGRGRVRDSSYPKAITCSTSLTAKGRDAHWV
jgi:hypothetical protein